MNILTPGEALVEFHKNAPSAEYALVTIDGYYMREVDWEFARQAIWHPAPLSYELPDGTWLPEPR